MRTAIDKFLKEFFTNYSKEKMKLNVLKGKAVFEDLVVNNQRIEALLDEINVPFTLKFGLLKNISVDVSIIGASLEEVTIEDLILVVGPNAALADRNFKLQKADRQPVILEMMENYKRYEAWVKEIELLEKSVYQASTDKEKKKQEEFLRKKISSFKMTRCNSIPSTIYNDMMSQEKKHYNAFAERGALSYQTMEDRYQTWRSLLTQIQSLLDAEIKIKYLRIYYEDTDTLKNLGLEKKNVVFCVFFQELILSKVSRSNLAARQNIG